MWNQILWPRLEYLIITLLNSNTAQVFWYKDGIIISQAIIKTRKEGKLEHHYLTISSMSESDYGNYSCLARNKLGTGTDSLFLSGTENI
jgi:hypothetical protein